LRLIELTEKKSFCFLLFTRFTNEGSIFFNKNGKNDQLFYLLYKKPLHKKKHDTTRHEFLYQNPFFLFCLTGSGSSLRGKTLGLLLADLGLRSSLKENEYFTVYQSQTLTEGLAFLAAAADFLASLLLAIAA
jgi:hypothetical protein